MSTTSQGSKPSSGWQPPTLEEMQAMLPQYRFERLLGRGGMGAVYKAVQASLDRAVAIKVLPGDLIDDTDAQFAERFKNEARTMAKMSHPSIVNVFDFGETQTGLLYIVMEFIDGTDVAQMILSQGRLPENYSLSITAHVCDALAYAHARGVIHRDIKPANILINVEGAVKVADFGLAKQSDPTQSGLTKTNMAMGTPDFVAPEALIPGVPLDGRADLYAIGVMLYNMLTGEIPRGMWQMPAQKVGSDPRFDAIIARAMQNDREARYQTASEIRQELDTILVLPRSVLIARQQAAAEAAAMATREQKQAEAPVKARPAPPPAKPKSSAGLIWSIAALLVAGAGGYWFLGGGEDNENATPSAALPKTTPVPSSTVGGPVFSNFVPTAVWQDRMAVDWTGWTRVGKELHMKPDAVNVMHKIPEAAAHGGLRVRFRATIKGQFIDLIQRQSPRQEARRYLATLWMYEKPYGFIHRAVPGQKNISLKDFPPLPEGGLDQEHTAELYALGDRLTYFLDGKLVAQATDSSYADGHPAVYAGRGFQLLSVETADLASDAATSIPLASTDGQKLEFGGHRYQIITTKASWSDAAKHAGELGGHLATLNSREEFEWLMKACYPAFAGQKLFLGGIQRDSRKAAWQWNTGEPFTNGPWMGDFSNDVSGSNHVLTLEPKGLDDVVLEFRPCAYVVEWTPGLAELEGAAPMKIETATPPGWMDLLATADARRDSIQEPWSITGGVLRSPENPASEATPDGHTLFTFPIDGLPLNYDLRYVISRERPGHAIVLPFVRGSERAAFGIDGGESLTLRGIPGRPAPGRKFFPPDGSLHEVIIEVRTDSVRSSHDGQVMDEHRGALPDGQNDSAFFSAGKAHGSIIGIGVCQGLIAVHAASYRPVVVPQEKPMASSPPAAPPAPADPVIARLESGFKARHESDAQKPFLAALDKLNQSYLANGIPKARAAAQLRGNLAEVTALDAEKARVEKKEAVPAEDVADTPEALKGLRQTYRAAFAKITAERDVKAKPLYDIYLKSLNEHIAALTKAGKISEATAAQTWRDQIAAQKPGGTTIATTTSPGTSKPVPPTLPATPKAVAAGGSVWRRAAEYLVTHGGSFVALKNGITPTVTKESEIPTGKFDIMELTIDHLNAAHPKPTETDLQVFNGLRDLRRVWIRLTGSELKESAFAWLAGNDDLDSLNLESAGHIGDGILSHLAGAKKLKNFQVQYSPNFSGAGMDQMPFAATLTSADFLSSALTDDGLRALAAMKKLEFIRIASCHVTDAGFAGFSGHKALVTLDANLTGLGDASAAALATMPQLTTLNLARTRLTDEGLQKLRALKKLTSLDVSGTAVTAEAAQAFQKDFPACRVTR